MADNPIDRILRELKDSGKNAVKRELDRALPNRPGMVQNPDNEDDNEDDGEEVDAEALAFEDDSAEDNLASAAAAYRMLGGDGDIIATHEGTGRAFFGTEDDLDEYCETQDLSGDDWEVYDDPKAILSLEYDQDTMNDILHQMRGKAMAESREMYDGFHWGDRSQVTSIKEIPALAGVTEKLTFLGVAREICYGAKKEGKFEEYFHEHGEESGTFPSIYALGKNTLVIHGGKMRIEDRGIVD